MQASAAVRRWTAANPRLPFCSWFPPNHSIAKNLKFLQSSRKRRICSTSLLDTGSAGFTAGGARLQLRDDVSVVLVEPQIPPNAGVAPLLQIACKSTNKHLPLWCFGTLNSRWLAAGNAARSCAAARVAMHLVRPLGFDLDSKRCDLAPSTCMLPRGVQFITCARRSCTRSKCLSSAASCPHATCRLKRAGLDYWPYVCADVHDSWAAFLAVYDSHTGPKRLVAYSKFATRHYAVDGTYLPGDFLLFGAETHGLPDCVRSPCFSSFRMLFGIKLAVVPAIVTGKFGWEGEWTVVFNASTGSPDSLT